MKYSDKVLHCCDRTDRQGRALHWNDSGTSGGRIGLEPRAEESRPGLVVVVVRPGQSAGLALD